MKYCIIHVNDRAKENIEYNKIILKDFEYIQDIVFFDGNIGKAWDILNHKGIRQDVWNPYDGRSSAPLPGELGIWVSTVNVLEYIVNNKIDKMLVLEDDITLQKDFMNKLKECLGDLPDSFDFLSLYYFAGQNEIKKDLDVGSDKIQKSNTQYSGGQATVYSYYGAKKLLKLIHRKGIEYTTDCFIFRQSLEGFINGYSIKGPNNSFLVHEYKKIKSLIDPDNTRNTDG